MKSEVRLSLVAKISLLFFFLTLLNVLIFWISSGSNQLRLIAEKATAEARDLVIGVRKKTDELAQRLPPRVAAAAFTALLKNTLESDKKYLSSLGISDFHLSGSDGKLLFRWPVQKTATSAAEKISPEEFKAVIKAVQLREFQNQQFYGESDLARYAVTAYMPVFAASDGEVVLVTRIEVAKIREELALLIRSALGIVGLLTGLQILVALLIYRKLLRPILAVTDASEKLVAGKHVEIEKFAKSRDELGLLVRTFNKMSSSIRDQKAEIEKNYKDLKKKSDIMNFELNIARKIQATILPKNFRPGALQVEAEYNPLYGVSGDYFDWFQFRDGSTGFVICDASGHGVPAALLTIMAKSYFSSFAEMHEDPARLLAAANTDISRALDGAGHYLTAFYARIYPDGLFRFSSATHPSPYLFDEESGEVTALQTDGFYIGLMETLPMEFESKEIRLKEKQKLVFYTDGITEAANPEGDMFGDERMKGLISEHGRKTPAELKAAILDKLDKFCAGSPLRDDVTLLVIEVGEILSGSKKDAALKEAIQSYKSFDFNRAIDIFHSLQSVSPESMGGGALSYFADTYFKLKNFAKALPLFDEYLARHGEHSVVLMKAGTCLMKERRTEEALAYFRRAIAADTGFAEAYAGLGACLQRLGRTAEALEAIETALRLKPGTPRFIKIRSRIKELTLV